ncbi:MAG TPA: site-specific integrase [Candidatus Binatia bacterium]|nr:site-specific integrase [Candidatus Binatia bacterium]
MSDSPSGQPADANSLRYWIFDRFLPQNLRARSDKTRRQYLYAINDFAEMLGREPTLDDLSDEQLARLVRHVMIVNGVREITANEKIGRIKTFWNWAARKNLLTGVREFPTIQRLPVPERVPRAWREDELVKIFNASRSARGDVSGIPAWRWWTCLHAWLWCSGERIGATLAMRPEHLRLDERVAIIPAEIRKGRRKPMVYRLWDDVVLMLAEILPPKLPPRERVFPWPFDPTSFYNHYHRLLDRARVPWSKGVGPHRMRVSHASWRYISGDDATRALGHSDPATTRKSYIDPSLAKDDEGPKLFRPW